MDQQITLNDRYELLERIGSGGMAAVYKARDKALGRLVAIKMLHENLTSDEGFLHRFRQEAHSAANLTHPNIVTVHDIGQDRYRHYIVMEFVDGQTLKQIIQGYNDKDEKMPLNRALDLAIGVCAGIGYAHRAGLVHCDVKPHNVLVTPDEQVKVADFGIARAISSATQQQIVSQVWGTPQYFSPEQASGRPMTAATDVYSIGVVLFEMLTGRLPFIADSHTAIALMHLNEPPPTVREFNPTVPLEIDQIIQKVLSKEGSGRYRTAGQLGRILTAYRKNSQLEGFSTTMRVDVERGEIVPIAEQVTQIYERPSFDKDATQPKTAVDLDEDTARRQPLPPPDQKPVRQTTGSQTAVDNETVIEPTHYSVPTDEQDWTAIALGIAAVVSLLGLIPLWLMVFLAWR